MTLPDHRGSPHWRRQRVTALALVPLTMVFVVLLPVLASSSHDGFRELMGTVAIPVFLAVLLAAGLWHMKLGLEAVIDDYAEGRARPVLKVLVGAASLALLATGLVSLAMLAAG